MAIARERAKRLALPWRVLFVLYAVALTIGTHWPRLDMSVGEYAAADKMVHFHAFAGLAILLRLTRWVRPAIGVFAIVVVWILLDEWTQWKFAVARSFSWMDITSGVLGAAVACLWIAAVQPVGGRLNRLRIAVQRYTFEELFAGLKTRNQRVSWLLLIVATVPSAIGLMLIWPIVVGELPNVRPAMIYGLSQTALLGVVIVIFQRVWTRVWRGAMAAARCPECGTAPERTPAGADGEVICPACGEALHTSMWLEPPLPPAGEMRRMTLVPVLVGGGFLAAGALAFYGVLAAFRAAVNSGRYTAGAADTVRALTDIPMDFVMVVDLAILVGGLAVLIFFYRRKLAAWHDAQGQRCRGCGYDVAHTATTDGVGRCPECGRGFGRASDRPFP